MKIHLMSLLIVLSFVFMVIAPASAQEGSVAEETQKRKDVRRYLELAGSRKTTKRIMTLSFNVFVKSDSTLSKEEVEAMTPMFNDKKMLSELFESQVAIYNDLFSHKEIKELIQFMETPAGRKLAAMQAEIARRSSINGKRIGKRNADRMKKATESLK